MNGEDEKIQINQLYYTSVVSEKELELKIFWWNNIKDKYLLKLKGNGILRMVNIIVWNK